MSTEISAIEGILKSEYSDESYRKFLLEIFDSIKLNKPASFHKEYSNFSSHIEGYSYIGIYTSQENEKIAMFSVQLQKGAYVESSRSTQRSYARKLIEAGNCDAAIIAFFTPDEDKWRLSFVRLDQELTFENGKTHMSTTLTPARRYSYLVGKEEPCHTAISRFHDFIINKNYNPSLADIEEAFSVEKVTKEFYLQYCEKYHQLREHLENNEDFCVESAQHNFTSAQFAKKLLGQIVFLYFLQKKGWLGVRAWPDKMTEKEYTKAFYSRGSKSRELLPKVYKHTGEDEYKLASTGLYNMTAEDEEILASCVKGMPWGSGPHNFMRRLFNIAEENGVNFFDDMLEPLFYNALNVNRGEQGYCPALHCRMPFLAGGLFEPIDGYEWQHNNFAIPNSFFSNENEKGIYNADGLLDIFDRYNFTMSEDEPMEREVAIDPEMLGKVFENLLDVTDRKSKGAFYTPREIVHYMCQESLINYLANKLTVPESDIRDLILYGDFIKDEDSDKEKRKTNGGMFISDNLLKLDKNGKVEINRLDELDNALKTVRVADPAVGSGAFPLGMLNEIVRARSVITEYMIIAKKTLAVSQEQEYALARNIRIARTQYHLKRETIRNCIFAADIEPSAVDIAQLRLWLSLVIDDEINPNATTLMEGSRNPTPLPNLESNILCGNSLIDEFESVKLIKESDLIHSDEYQTTINQSQFDEILAQLIEAQDDLFKCANTEEKKQLKERISDLRDAVINEQLKGCDPALIQRYEETKSLSAKPYILWQLDFARVFREKGGFDIVIGNPPYIQLQKTINEDTGEKLGDLYEPLKFKTFAKTGDIYCLFYEKGYQLLHEDGILTFITSNKWMRAGYGEKLRTFFANNTNPVRLIDFGSQKIFESATVDVNVLLFTKGENKKKTLACIAKEDCTSNLSVYVELHSSINDFNTTESWVILSPLESSIRSKIKSQGIPLSDWNLSINYGIKTGLNDAFIISAEKKDELIASDPKSAEIIRPILRGKDIKRYHYSFANLWLINVHNGIKSENLPRINIEDYPAVKKHLDLFYSKLSERADKGDTPYNLRNCVYLNEFFKQKIVYREISDAMDACLVEAGYMLNNKCYLITGDHLIYILSYLNSKLFTKIVLPQANLTGGKGEGFLREIRLIPPTHEVEEELERLYDLRKDNAHSIDEEIDNMFCSLYGLSTEERKYIIEESIMHSR